MARRRYISTEIGIDRRIAAICGEERCFTLCLYLLMIPHADDFGELTADPFELLNKVIPVMRWAKESDIIAALDEMCKAGLIEVANETIFFPLESFYKYQSYINTEKQFKAEERRKSLKDNTTPQNTEEHRTSPQNTVSPSPSPSPSPFSSKKKDTMSVEEKIPYEKIGKLWNELCGFSKINSVTHQRRVKIKTRWCEWESLEKVAEIFTRIKNSPFCRGEAKRTDGMKPWIASFDWIIANEQNWVKVLEGKYDSNKPQSEKKGGLRAEYAAQYDTIAPPK